MNLITALGEEIIWDQSCFGIIPGESGDSNEHFAVGRAFNSAIDLARLAAVKLNPLMEFKYKKVFNQVIGEKTSVALPKNLLSRTWQLQTDHPIRIYCSGDRFAFSGPLELVDGKRHVANHERGGHLEPFDPDDPNDKLVRCFNTRATANRIPAFYTPPREDGQRRFHDIQLCPTILNVLSGNREYETIKNIKKWEAMNNYKPGGPFGGISGREHTAMDASVLLDAFILHELTHAVGTDDNREGARDLALLSDKDISDRLRNPDDPTLSWNNAESLMYLALGFQAVDEGVIPQDDGSLKGA
ncbi:MAG: hypothetical protein Q9160_007521 [Pyrenula sp. 1 TL-2023]